MHSAPMAKLHDNQSSQKQAPTPLRGTGKSMDAFSSDSKAPPTWLEAKGITMIQILAT